MAAQTFRKKQQQQSRVFFGVIFYVYTNVDNREELERVIENKGDEHGNSKRRWENEELAASKVKMSGGEYEHRKKNIG